MKQLTLLHLIRPNLLKSLLQVFIADRVTLAGIRAYVPGSLQIRISVVIGNLRMQRMLDVLAQPGDTIVDVGANIGYNTLYASRRVGAHGRVYAIEPAQDNLEVLYANLFANDLRNVFVLPFAAGARVDTKQFYLRGDVSAVNSLYHENFYATVTDTVEVYIAPLDELIPDTPALVKIDVEGAELEVLRGMERILTSPLLHLIVEWHPTLQVAAGYAPDALPKHLLTLGFKLQVVTHTNTSTLEPAHVPALTENLLYKRSPVELLAFR